MSKRRRPDPLARINKMRGGKMTPADVKLFARLVEDDDLSEVIEGACDLLADVEALKNWRSLDELLAQDPSNLLDKPPARRRS